MKLILCRRCGDVYSLSRSVSTCICDATEGQYLDDVNAVYKGADAVPLGIENTSFEAAVKARPATGDSAPFRAFVIPADCSTFRKVER